MNPKNNEKDITRAKMSAFRLLKVRIRSERELQDRLAQNQFSLKIINVAIKDLKKIKLIDDNEFARSWIQSRINRGFGQRRIILELKQKSVSEKIIQNQFKKAQENYSPKAVIKQLIEKRLKRYKNLEPIKIKRRIYEFLVRRGFDIDSILKELQNI